MDRVNTDEAAKGNLGKATCDGLLGNGLGHWKVGFSRNIGYCSTHIAGLWGVIERLEITWAQGFRKVILKSDSQVLIGRPKHQHVDNSINSILLMRCRELFSRGLANSSSSHI